MMKLTTLRLTAFHLKIIAVLTMTLDHFATYVYDYPGFHTIGRIAAVLFLYCLTESIRHTKSKKALLLRLYMANVLIVITTALFNWIVQFVRSDFPPYIGVPKIFGTLFLVALFLILSEKVVVAFSQKHMRTAIRYSVLIALAIVLPILALYYMDRILLPPFLPILDHFGLADSVVVPIFSAGLIQFVPNVIVMEYSFFFILIGLFWYYFPKRGHQVLTLLLFSVLSYLGSHYLDGPTLWPMQDFFYYEQYWMILACPCIALYQGERGPSFKYFFYAYYPLHIYLLFLIGIQ